MIILLSTFLPLISVQLPAVSADCAISTNGDLGEPQPLIVNLNYTIRHPQTTDVVSFSGGENFMLSCPGTHLQVGVGDQKLNFSETETTTCVSDKQFTIQNTTTLFTNITCVQYPIQIARSTNDTCEEENQEIEIGFSVNSVYIRLLHICFDNKTHVTLYSHLQQKPSIRGRQSGFPRPSWINDDFYNFGRDTSNKDANGLLYNNIQIATISQLIGYNSTTSNPYINNTANLYLARGHLVAKADFAYGAEQRATFSMVNAAPQWQTFNGINWAYAEADARDLASDYELTLETYTGTYGVMTLPHWQTNETIPIYMYNDDKGNQEFPTPLLYWKYMYEPVTQSGIVLVGVNDPYITNISEAIFCEDIYESLNWTTTFSRNNIVNGYMYVCAPNDLRRTITYMPNLPLKYLLTLNSTYNTSIDYSSAATISCSLFSIMVFVTLSVIR